MSSWQDVWPSVETEVRASQTRGEAVGRVKSILGKGITWDALQRAWKRHTGVSILDSLGQVGTGLAHIYNDVAPTPEPPSPGVAPWHEAPVRYSQPGPARVLVIPDTQVMPGVALSHFTAVGRYAVAKRPDYIIHLGDFRDMQSLSSYESPTRRAHEGRCKVDDIESGNRAIELFETELAKAPDYKPTKIMLMGNHDGWSEHGRIGRYLADHPDDRRLFEKVPLLEKECGWNVHEFLQTVEVQGVLYSHLFPFSAKGTVTGGSLRMGAASASAQVKAVMQSCTAGHKQGLDVAIHNTPVNTLRSLIAGSFYQHTDSYLPGARFWRGVLLKTECQGGNYGLVEVSLDFLLRRYL
jgi:hypothetical protein